MKHLFLIALILGSINLSAEEYSCEENDQESLLECPLLEEPVFTKTTPFQISLFTPFQTTPVDVAVRGLRLNLIYGNNVYLEGVDFGFFNRVQGDAKALQIGFINYIEGNFSGVQGGAVNVVQGDFSGLQRAYYNRVKGNFLGIQSGLINITDKSLRGIEAAFLNYAKSVEGIQFGLLNISSDVHGLQFGLLNITNSLRGVQIGIINVQTNRTIFKALPLLNISF